MLSQGRRLAQNLAMIAALVFAIFACVAVIGGEWDYLILDGAIAVILASWALRDAT